MNPRIVAISGPFQGSEFFIEGRDLKIGRGAGNDVRLNDPLVSLKHCCLTMNGDSCHLVDFVSEHGTFVNEF